VLKDIPPDGNGAAVPSAEQAHGSLELFDTVITSIFDVGLNLQVAMDLPADAAREHIAAAVVSSTRPSARSATPHSPPAVTRPRRALHRATTRRDVLFD
jgi:hypothetical protein